MIGSATGSGSRQASIFVIAAVVTGLAGRADHEVPGRLAEFLAWAHPSEAGCAPPRIVAIEDRWAGGLRARYEVSCGSASRVLRGVFRTREGETVWQVAAGYETEVVPDPGAIPATGPEGAAFAPPPDVLEDPGDPLAAARPPRILREARPELPEEAGRARLVGSARVELLVDLGPDGVPARTRPLRGPDPDLGMRQAAAAAIRRYRFEPPTIGGQAVRYFLPVEITFPGLPPESRHWMQRAIYQIEAIVSPDPRVVEAARDRILAGEPFAAVAKRLPAAGQGGDWGLVPAATLPAPVRRALHEAWLNSVTGPVEAEGLHYLLRKRGEVYYAIRPWDEGEGAYRVVHQMGGPEGAELRSAIESDIISFLAEDRRLAYMNDAARLMGIRQVRVESGQLLIQTDVLDESELRILGEVVASLFQAHAALWAPAVSARPFGQQVLVYALGRNADYDELHRLLQPGGDAEASDRAARVDDVGPGRRGKYIPASRILSIACEDYGGHLPVPALMHEAVHMLNHERIYDAGARPSRWFEEGLATYFGASQVDSRLGIEPGDIRRSGTIVTGTVRLQFDPRAQLLAYRRVRDARGPVPLRPLIAIGPEDPAWRGPAATRTYGAAWTLVHFLLHGEKGRHRARFLEYAGLEARGAGGPAAFERLLGPLDSLEDAWHDHEDRL